MSMAKKEMFLRKASRPSPLLSKMSILPISRKRPEERKAWMPRRWCLPARLLRTTSTPSLLVSFIRSSNQPVERELYTCSTPICRTSSRLSSEPAVA